MHKTSETNRLIHENFAIVVAFAFSQPPISKVMKSRFRGNWEYLCKSVFELSEVRADRALLEMATQLRVLDDAEQVADYFAATGKSPFGTVTQGDGTTTDLHFRDLTNKIIHAASFEWSFDDPDNPMVICIPQERDLKRWQRAEVHVLSLMGLVGGIMF